MNEGTQERKRDGRGRISERPEGQPLYVVGMDAHSTKLAVSVWEWSDPWNPVFYKRIPCFDVGATVKTYERHVPLDSITLIEASTNSMKLKRDLEDAGYRSEVVRPDAVKDKERKRKVCDSKDAENLALAYIHGDIREFVWAPNGECAEYRDVLFACRDCEKDLTRTGNRIWSICNRKGFRFGIVGGTTKADVIRKKIGESRIDGIIRKRLAMLVDDYENNMKRREEPKVMMAEYVFGNDVRIALMQLPGVNCRTALATVAAVGDVSRFPKASKLAAYGGFSPVVNASGEEEMRARGKAAREGRWTTTAVAT